MKHTDNNTSTPIQVPVLTRAILNPEQAVYDKCSPYTRNNLKNISFVLAFTVTICGAILGASLTEFAFNDNAWTYLFTIPIGIAFYLILDRLVVMADAKMNLSFIKWSRYFIAAVLAIYNSFLIDTSFFRTDIEAERAKEIVMAEAQVQKETDDKKKAVQLHKEETLEKVKEAQSPLKKRSDELISEAEGTGFSKSPGRGAIYQVKKEAFDRDSIEVARQVALLIADAQKDDSMLLQLDREAITRKKHIPAEISTGPIHTLELLHRVILRESMNTFIAILFFLICVILELLPLLAKSYIDLSEYFKHAWSQVEAYLELQDTHKQHIVKEERHRRTLEHRFRCNELSNRFSLSYLEQKLTLGENVLKMTADHFATVVGYETDLAQSFPDHFDDHIAPVFHQVYRSFRQNHPKAFSPASSDEELVMST